MQFVKWGAVGIPGKKCRGVNQGWGKPEKAKYRLHLCWEMGLLKNDINAGRPGKRRACCMQVTGKEGTL